MADISYTKTTWVNGTTALNADNLNNIEIGVDNATKAINNKVDKVTGKGLSTHDFDDHYKNVIDNLQGEGGISVIELTNKNGTIASTQLGEINANPQNFAFKYNGKILLFTSADSTTYQYCNNTTSSSDNNVMTTSTRLTITSSTGAYTIAENVHNVAANSIHPVNGGDLTNIQVGSKVYSIPSGGGGIPVVEGTVIEQTAEGITITIPEAQTEPFILHIEDIQSYILMSVIMGAYLGYLYEGRNEKVAYIFQGADTTIDVSITNPIVPIVNATNTDNSDRYTIPSSQELAFILHIEDSTGISNIFMSATNDGTLYYYYGIEDITSNSITYLYGRNNTVQRHRIKISAGGGSSTSSDSMHIIVKKSESGKITLTEAEFDNLTKDNYELAVINGSNLYVYDEKEVSKNSSTGIVSSIGFSCSIVRGMNQLVLMDVSAVEFTRDNLVSNIVSYTSIMTQSKLFNKKVMTYDSYTPENILPCTTTDNGKVLSVVNGEAQWASASGGVSVTFED